MNDCKCIANVKCQHIYQCSNNSCILRLQSVFGLCHFKQHEGFDEVLSKAKVNYAQFPRVEFINKAHGVDISCKDFIDCCDE